MLLNIYYLLLFSHSSCLFYCLNFEDMNPLFTVTSEKKVSLAWSNKSSTGQIWGVLISSSLRYLKSFLKKAIYNATTIRITDSFIHLLKNDCIFTMHYVLSAGKTETLAGHQFTLEKSHEQIGNCHSVLLPEIACGTLEELKGHQTQFWRFAESFLERNTKKAKTFRVSRR